MSWVGNPENVGTGELVTTKVEKNKVFLYELSFLVPFEMTSQGGFTYESFDDYILVSWHDAGEFGFMMRPMMMFMDIEAELGPQFEEGLADIKKICENLANNPSVNN
jgi:hypothetical protein